MLRQLVPTCCGLLSPLQSATDELVPALPLDVGVLSGLAGYRLCKYVTVIITRLARITIGPPAKTSFHRKRNILAGHAEPCTILAVVQMSVRPCVCCRLHTGIISKRH